MPFIITTKVRVDAPDLHRPEWVPERVTWSVSHRAVAMLEERVIFDDNEWERTGYDKPDGNLQHYHPALILSKSGRGKDEIATVLFLHDGRVSPGHFTSRMDTPGGLTLADRKRWPYFPERWPDALVPESGGRIGPLPSGTVIEAERWPGNDVLSWAHFYGPGSDASIAEIVDAYNTMQPT